MSQKDFAAEIGVTPNSVHAYEAGETIPGGKVLSVICGRFDIDGNWLLTGKGYDPERLVQKVGSPLPERYRLLAEHGRQKGIWRTLFVISTYFPNYVSYEEILADLDRNGWGRDPDELARQIAVLETEGLVETRGRQAKIVRQGQQIIATEAADAFQIAGEGITILREQVLPALEAVPKRGKIFTALLSIRGGDGRKALKDVIAGFADISEKYEDETGDELLTLVFGGAYQKKVDAAE